VNFIPPIRDYEFGYRKRQAATATEIKKEEEERADPASYTDVIAKKFWVWNIGQIGIKSLSNEPIGDKECCKVIWKPTPIKYNLSHTCSP
jgi:hypothetical protein